MWPQKWNASASPGLTRAVTAVPPAASASNRDARARKPRREVDLASPSASGVMSGMGVHAPLRRREDSLELSVAVERPLRPHASARVERNGVRAAGNPELAPHSGIVDLVEFGHVHEGVAAERGDDRLQRAAEAAALRGEDRKRQAGRRRLGRELYMGAERRPLAGDVERGLGSETQAEDAH